MATVVARACVVARNWVANGASVLAAAAVDAAAANMAAVQAADVAAGAGAVNHVIIGPDGSTSES